ncbi:hypothetical protein [Streptomyces lincolnensis]|uniref:hypothetical protein n=1 Tax=Streptomyces lincolnensis TaxID=1915 RepID=UPI0037CF6678
MTTATQRTRLLPWATPDGKPCFLSGDGTGYLSRMADDVENVQLGMADELLAHATDMLAAPRATPDQLRFLLSRMTESLTDVKRIADSRGARLPDSDADLLTESQEDEDEAYDDGEQPLPPKAPE